MSNGPRWCRVALRSRGLREKDVRMGYKVTSPRFADRLTNVLRGHDRSFRDRVSRSIFSAADAMMG